MIAGRRDPAMRFFQRLNISEGLVDSLSRVIRLFKLNLREKPVLLKPNLVEYIPGVEVNTNPVLVGATAEAFLRLGANRVVVGEGPGHQRDTYLALVESGLDVQLRSQGIGFVDLNRPLHGMHRHLGKLVLSDDAVAADFTCARLMGLLPERVLHLDHATRFLGHWLSLIGLCFSQRDCRNGFCRSVSSHSSHTCGCRCRHAR